MTKNDIADMLCKCCGLSKSTANNVVDSMSAILARAFVSGENVYLRGFGTFQIKTTGEKKARDISRGTTVIIPAGRTVKFRISNELKKRMNNDSVD